MADIKHNYMTVSVDVMPDGLNLSMWMSTQEFWASEVAHFPYQFTYMGEFCTWILHSNIELTVKMIVVVGEQADEICIRQEKINRLRKLINR